MQITDRDIYGLRLKSIQNRRSDNSVWAQESEGSIRPTPQATSGAMLGQTHTLSEGFVIYFFKIHLHSTLSYSSWPIKGHFPQSFLHKIRSSCPF
jgi:hypothetical protein